MGRLRGYLAAGLLFWVPFGVTILIIKFMVETVDGILDVLPAHWHPSTLIGFNIPGLGVLLVLVVVILTGMVVTNLFGRQLIQLGEKLLARIPLVRSIYGGVKQVAESLFSGSGKSFRHVLLVRYPHPSSWTIAFQTGEGTKEIKDKSGRNLISVFVPTTPNPTSGFFLLVPKEETLTLDMSVDEGLKMLLSIGVVVPDAQKPVTPPAG